MKYLSWADNKYRLYHTKIRAINSQDKDNKIIVTFRFVQDLHKLRSGSDHAAATRGCATSVIFFQVFVQVVITLNFDRTRMAITVTDLMITEWPRHNNFNNSQLCSQGEEILFAIPICLAWYVIIIYYL